MGTRRILILSVILVLELVFAVADLNYPYKSVDGNEITIKQIIGGDLAKIDLIENTGSCGVTCYTIWNVTIYKEASDFLTTINFKDISGNLKSIDYKFEYSTNWTAIKIPIYKQTCKEINVFNHSLSCSKEITGYENQNIYEWKEIDIKNPPIGNYYIKLTGYKDRSEDIDWIPEFYGQKITEWAWWFSSSPYAYYKLNEANGNAVDSSGANHLLYNSGSTFTAGKLNNAANGFGSSKWLKNLSLVNFGASSYTFALWVKYSGTPSIEMAVLVFGSDLGGAAGTIQMTYRTSGAFRIVTDGGGLIERVGLNDNVWHRIVNTYDAGSNNLSMFVDGSWVNGTILADVDLNDAGFYLGGIDATPTAYFTGGYIDDVQLYNVTWTADDVIVDYNSGSGREADDLTGLAFDDLTIRLPFNATYNVSAEVRFNVSTTKSIDFCRFSLDNFAANITMDISASLNGANYTNFSMIQGQQTSYFWCNDTDGNINNTEERTFFLDSLPPKITIHTPVNGNSKTFSVNISITDLSNSSAYCWFNITRGAGLEIANTEIPSCLNITAVVSSYADYVINVGANDTLKHTNSTSKSFTISSADLGGGGGGGGTIIEIIKEALIQEPNLVCESFYPSFSESWIKFFHEINLVNFVSMFRSLYDYIICGSASSIIRF